jgi:hypothetical protein
MGLRQEGPLDKKGRFFCARRECGRQLGVAGWRLRVYRRRYINWLGDRSDGVPVLTVLRYGKNPGPGTIEPPIIRTGITLLRTCSPYFTLPSPKRGLWRLVRPCSIIQKEVFILCIRLFKGNKCVYSPPDIYPLGNTLDSLLAVLEAPQWT